MDNSKELKSGVILSYINLAISVLIPILYTPIILKLLGKAEYGLYSLANSVVSYLSLLSFGFGATILRYISKYRAEKDQAALEKVFGFFLLLFAGIAVLVMVGGVGISLFVDRIFQEGLTEPEIGKMRVLVLIMAFHSAIVFPVSVYTSVIIAHERFIFRKIMDIIYSAAVPLANLIAIYLGYTSIGMAVASLIVEIMIIPINISYCHRKLRIKPRFERIPKALIHEMLGVSLFHFIGAIVDFLFWSTDKVIIGMFISSAAVAVYNVGVTFHNMVQGLSSSVSSVLTPRITMKVCRGDTDPKELTDVFIKIGRIQFLIIGLVLAGFSVFGQAFIKIWAGAEYAESFWVAVLTMYPLCIPLIQSTGLTIVTAQNKHKFRSIIYLVIAVLNAVSTYLLVPHYGIIAAAACSCVAYLLGHGLVMNIYYHHVIGIDIPLFWKNIGKMAIVPIFMTAGGLLLKKAVVIDTWMAFITGAAVFTLVYAALMWVFAMNDYEKSILIKPVKRLRKRGA